MVENNSFLKQGLKITSHICRFVWTIREMLILRELNRPVFYLITDNRTQVLWLISQFIALFTVDHKHKYIVQIY